jgi:hypothetical protein
MGSVFFNSVRFTGESGRNSGDDAIGSMLPCQSSYQLDSFFHSNTMAIPISWSMTQWPRGKYEGMGVFGSAMQLSSPLRTTNQEPLQSILFIPNERNTSGVLWTSSQMSRPNWENGFALEHMNASQYARRTHIDIEHADRILWECRRILLEKVRHLPGVVANPSGTTPDYFVKIGLFIVMNEGMMQAKDFTPPNESQLGLHSEPDHRHPPQY